MNFLYLMMKKNFLIKQIKMKIQDICNKFNITCINISNEKHKRNNEDSMNYILEYQKNNPDKNDARMD